MSERIDLMLVVDTIKDIEAPGTLLHSDQGFQYTTKTYTNLLEKKNLRGSHSRRGNCYDNACIESFFLSLKDGETVLREAQRFGGCPKNGE